MEEEIKKTASKNTKDDWELVRQAKQNSSRATEKLVKKYRKAVYYMILKIVSNPDDAEDLTQEAFAKAFNSLARYDETFAFSTWLFRIASNGSIDFIRKRKLNTVPIDLGIETEDGETQGISIVDPDYDPNEQMLRKQRKEILEKILVRLPEKYRILLELRYFEDLTYEEIAQKLGLPLGTVKAQLFKAKSLMNNEMKGFEDKY